MRCHTKFSLKPQTPCTIFPTKIPTFSVSCSLSQAKPLKPHILALSSSTPIQNTQENTISRETQQKLNQSVYKVEFRSMGGCKLGIARYPDFEYNASGGSGTGSGLEDSNGAISVSFDVSKLYIPSLTSDTTKFIGLPLPPLLRIDIVPETFEGSIDKESGKVDLEFKAKFWFSVGTIYKAPPLLVATVLTSEESEGRLRKGTGRRMDRDGNCKLVGVATVEPINDIFMDSFLGLPTECLAILNATISL